MLVFPHSLTGFTLFRWCVMVTWRKKKQVSFHVKQTWFTPEFRQKIALCILNLTLLHLADFHRRSIFGLTKRDPHNFLMIAKRGTHVRYDDRLRTARRLVTTDEARLHLSAKKVQALFHDELLKIVKLGGLCPLRIPRTLRASTIKSLRLSISQHGSHCLSCRAEAAVDAPSSTLWPV